MPRLDPAAQRLAFFVSGIDPKSGRRRGPFGSGVFIWRDWEKTPQRQHVYAVTNYHVAIPNNATIINSIRGNGGHSEIEINFDDWQYDVAGDDLAIVDITDLLKPDDWVDLVVSPYNKLVSRQFASEYELGMGEDVFMVGLLASHGGEPVGRFGNLAALPDEKAPVMQGHERARPSFLIDMRSRGGFSGSPVMVYRTQAGDLSHMIYQKSRPLPRHTDMNKFLRLLGIHSAQFPEEAKVSSAEAAEAAEASGDPLREGGKIHIPSGMTVVVPAWRIADLMNNSYFEKIRIAREAGIDMHSSKTPA